MKNHSYLRIGVPVLALLVVVACIPWLRAQTSDSPSIEITDVPPTRTGNPDEMYPIGGKVTGAPKDAKVVIYCFAGGKWWVQPFDYAPFTEVKSGGKFETETHPGSIYAALLVKPGYKPVPITSVLPDTGGDVLARHRIAGKRE